MVLALGAAPGFAAPVSGLYAGIYAGGSVRNDAQFDFDIIGGLLSTTGVVETPASFVNGGIDPLLFDYLNEAISEYPFADFAIAGGALTEGTLAFAPSFIGGGVVGYGLGNGVRIEADFSATSFAAGDYTPVSGAIVDVDGAIDAGGTWTWTPFSLTPLPSPPPPTPLDFFGLELKTDVQFLLINALYDIDTGTRFTPYLGGGVGVARVLSTLTDFCGCGSFTNSTIVPAAQLGGGIRISLSDPVTFDIGYRYKLAASPNLQVHQIPDASVSGFPAFLGFATQQSGVIGVHTLQAGLSFALN